MASAFKYTPLDDPSQEIRLLRFKPGDSISCRISVHQHKDAPPYRAISYAWGDASSPHKILVEGKQFLVRKNCLCALRQARRHLPERTYIWMDAICIDQDNLVEKGCQVAIMDQLFYDASAVFVSIGEHHDDSAFLFKMAADFGRIMGVPCYRTEESEYHRKVEISEGWIDRYGSWIDFVHEVDLVRLEKAYEAFVQRPYWRRMWIIQEIRQAAGIEVACGSACIDLELLLPIDTIIATAAAKVFAKHIPRHIPKESDRENHGEDYFLLLFPGQQFPDLSRFERQPLSEYTSKLELYRCADIRDRIDGLLGLVDWGEKGPPTPDYRIEPYALALDVLERQTVGRQLHDIGLVSGVLEALGIRSVRIESSLTATALEGKVDAGGPPPQCNCVIPTSPRTTIVDSQSPNLFVHELFVMRGGVESSHEDVSPMTEPPEDPLTDEYLGASDTDMSPIAGPQKDRLTDGDIGSSCAHVSCAPEPQRDPPIDEDTASSCLQTSPKAEPEEDFLNDEDAESSWTDTLSISESELEEKQTLREKSERLYRQARREDFELMGKYDLRQGDTIVQLSEWPRPQRWNFGIVLRETHGGYYEILDEAVKVSIPYPADHGRGGLWREFCLCLDPKDAVSMFLALQRLKARVRSGELVGTERHSLRDSGFTSKVMSSYAMRVSIKKATKVGEAFSVDGKMIPCAECGGLFEPEGAVREEYRMFEGWAAF